MATSNRIRALNRLPFDFQDGLKVAGVDVTALNQIATANGAGLVGVTPVGGVLSTNVQAALAELDNKKATKVELASSGGSKTVGYLPYGSLSQKTDLETKLREFTSVTDYMTDAEKADILLDSPLLDHTAAIQKALDNNNYIDFLDGRNYRVNGNLVKTVASGKTLVIRGKSTMKRYSETGALLKIIGNQNTRLHVQDIIFDGNQQGVIRYNSSNPVAELHIVGVSSTCTTARFTNTSYCSLLLVNCPISLVKNSEFSEGVSWYGSSSATTSYHIQASQCGYLEVDSNRFYTSINYDPGNYNSGNPQGAVLASAPIAVYVDYTDTVKIRNNDCNNSGHFDIYEKVGYVSIKENKIKNTHGPVKVQNFIKAEIENNTIENPLHYWGASISANPYIRLNTYGWVAPNQGDLIIRGNKITGCRSREGVIGAGGVVYSAATLDQRIAQQGANTVNIVYKVGSDYFYKDFDSATYGPITQDYLCAKSIVIENNRVEKYATTGILAYFCSTEILIENNKVFNAAALDTVYSYTKTIITAANCPIITIDNNLLKMDNVDVPKVSGAESFVIGISTYCDLYSQNAYVVSVRGNRISLGYVQQGVHVYDSSYLNFQNNVFSLLSFKGSGVFFRASRKNNVGRFSGNTYSLLDVTNAPAVASEYVYFQANFNSVIMEDRMYSFSNRNVRYVASSLDYTSPNQVAAGIYAVGSIIYLDTNVSKRYWRCESAGCLAPMYSAATSYTTGNKIKSAENNYFVANKTNLGIAPPTTAVSNSDWSFISSTTATFSEYGIPLAV